MARYHFDCPLRWSDMDAFGHVNNARFLTLYEEARVSLMFTAARESGTNSFESGVVIARHEIDYLLPVDHGNKVHIEMWVEEIRNSSFTMAYELFANGAVASRARSVLVPYDLTAGRSRRINDVEREYLEAWRD